MNRQFIKQQMRFVLGIGGFMSFYGIAGLAIFFSGKYLGVRPSMRIVIFGMLLLTIPIALIGGYFARKGKKKKEAAKEAADATKSEDSGSDAGSDKPAAPSGNYAEFSSGANEVVSFLKSSNLGAAGKESVYSLPWYLVIGGKGSGKTSLILGSGLNLQNLPSQRQSELNLVRPTKQIDWRVTSDAVFIDTAGRFQTDADLDEWSSLIDTIKKHRPKRPLDGLLLTVNTEILLNSGERDIEEQAKALRARLDDATKRLKTRFPVYLVFTHADAIEGFRDSFSTSKKDGENLVWGTTIPLEKSDNAQSLFDSEYELLQDSVMKRRLIRLSAPFSPVRQLRILNFPLHFGSARRKLGGLVSTLFRPNPFSESPFLRGFYFTAAPANLQRGKGKPGKLPQTLADPYFTKKFFKKVVLRDKDLVSTFLAQKQRAPIFGWFMTALGTLLVATLLGLAGLSLYLNKQLTNDVTAAGEEVNLMLVADREKDLSAKSTQGAQDEIEKIEALRVQLDKLDTWEREGPPLWYRFGFYSGSKLYRERLLYIYYVAVEKRFRQPTLARLEKELLAFAKTPDISASSMTPDEEKLLDKHYDYLKAYLMLTNEYKDRSEATTLATALEEIWVTESKLPAGNGHLAKSQLDFYFKQIDREAAYSGDTSQFPRIPEDKNLIEGARKKLAAFPAYLRYLKLQVAEVSKEIDPVTVDTILQGRSQGVIKGSHPVPGAFTIEGYRRFMKQSFVDAATTMNKDDWVMGRKEDDADTTEDDLVKLKEKYFNDYTDHWRKLIRETTVPVYKNQAEMEDTLRVLSSTDSPMKILLSGIAANTDFSTKSEAKSWFDLSWIDDWWSGNSLEDGQENQNTVEREFSPLFEFIGSGEEDDAKAPPVSEYGSMMKELYEDLGNITPGQKTEITNELIKGDGKRYSLIKGSENKANDLTSGFTTTASKEVAILLKSPVISIRSYFGAGAMAELEKDWTQRILPQARSIESGYPFTTDGEADLTKLKDYLNPVTGEFSKFFKERLERYFEEVEGQWKVKDSSDIKFSPAFVSYLNNAMRLRRTLFGENATPNFEYDFRLLPVEDALIEVSIDGQTVTSNETGSKKLKFPAATGSSNGVLMRFSSTAAVPVPTTGGSANSPNSNVNTSGPSALAPVSNFQEDSGSGEIRRQGTWGLFRFFELGQPKKQADGDYLLTYELGGKTVQATIKPTGGDLFDKSIFTSVKAPDKMQN